MVRKKEIVKVGETKIEIEKIKRRETGTQKLYFRDIITTIFYSLSQREKKREKEREGGEREREQPFSYYSMRRVLVLMVLSFIPYS